MSTFFVLIVPKGPKSNFGAFLLDWTYWTKWIDLECGGLPPLLKCAPWRAQIVGGMIVKLKYIVPTICARQAAHFKSGGKPPHSK
jgi:hypothetical protein